MNNILIILIILIFIYILILLILNINSNNKEKTNPNDGDLFDINNDCRERLINSGGQCKLKNNSPCFSNTSCSSGYCVEGRCKEKNYLIKSISYLKNGSFKKIGSCIESLKEFDSIVSYKKGDTFFLTSKDKIIKLSLDFGIINEIGRKDIKQIFKYNNNYYFLKNDGKVLLIENIESWPNIVAIKQDKFNNLLLDNINRVSSSENMDYISIFLNDGIYSWNGYSWNKENPNIIDISYGKEKEDIIKTAENYILFSDSKKIIGKFNFSTISDKVIYILKENHIYISHIIFETVGRSLSPCNKLFNCNGDLFCVI